MSREYPSPITRHEHYLAAIADRAESSALGSKMGALIDTATGSIASFVPDSTVPTVKGLTVNVEPIQDLHGYDAPWPAGGGVNKFASAHAETKTLNGITIVSDGMGQYTISGTANAFGVMDFDLINEFTIPESIGQGGNGCLYLNNNFTANNNVFIPVFMYNDTTADSWTLSEVNKKSSTYSAMSGKKCNRIRFKFYAGASISGTIAPMISDDGSTNRDFMPYSNICPISGWDAVEVKHSGADMTNPTTYTIQLGQTVYGCKIDATAGKMVVDRAEVNMTSITDWAIDRGAKRIYKVLSYIKPNVSGATIPNMLSNRFDTISPNDIYSNKQGVTVSVGSALQFHIDGLTDNADVTQAEVNQWFTDNPTTVVYELATPITISLTPIEVAVITGQTNNIWADCGNVSVEYAADLKTYIDQKIAAAASSPIVGTATVGMAVVE